MDKLHWNICTKCIGGIENILKINQAKLIFWIEIWNWICTFLSSNISALLAKRLKTAEEAPESLSEAVSRRDYTFFNEKSKTGFVGLSNQGKFISIL